MTFTFTIPENELNRITFDYDEEAREQFDVRADGDQIYLFANSEGMITLAKLLLKIAHGSYNKGFHVHLRKDFNADSPDVLTVGLTENRTATVSGNTD
jgi:hypothetical protein